MIFGDEYCFLESATKSVKSAEDTGEPVSAPHFEVVMLMLSYWGAASCVIAFESARQETDFS